MDILLAKQLSLTLKRCARRLLRDAEADAIDVKDAAYIDHAVHMLDEIERLMDALDVEESQR